MFVKSICVSLMNWTHAGSLMNQNSTFQPTRKSVRLPDDSIKSDLKNIQMFVFWKQHSESSKCHFLKLDRSPVVASELNICLILELYHVLIVSNWLQTAVLFFTKPKWMGFCSFFQTDKKPDTLWDWGKIVQNLHSFWDSLP